MKIPTVLAIDTSCDETSASIIRGCTVMSNVMPSQMEFHQKYGGVVPSLAKLAHQERIANVVKEAIRRSGITIDEVDLIAVTYGPGLAIALEVGIRKAKELAQEYDKPLMRINHMEGHLLSCFAMRKTHSAAPLPLEKGETEGVPTLGFLVSGGHTELVLVKGIGDYRKIGETLDDSCGEAYDKCGRMLGLGYPGGPVISEFAKRQRKNMEIKTINRDQSTLVVCKNKKTGAVYELPIPMVHSGDLNFSYSGLKTAFSRLIQSISSQEEGAVIVKEQIMDLCVTFEAVALAQLKIKLEKAIKEYSPKEVWLGGGVVASARLRSEMRKVCRNHLLTSPFSERPTSLSSSSPLMERVIMLRYPYTKKLTGDNAAMIGVAASLRAQKYFPELNFSHMPEVGLFLKDFDSIDREPSLSF